MKILKMLGLVVAVHIVVLTFGFILPGCQSTARTSPSAADKTIDTGNMSRIDAARASTPLGGQPPAPATTRPPAAAQQAPSPITPAPTPAYAGGPVTDFGVPVPDLAPTRPQTAAENPALPPEQTPASLTYTVVPGDSLWKIAKKFKTTTAALQTANNLTTTATLQAGQKLLIPAKALGQTTPATTAQPGATVYKVKSGDSLATIARRNNTTVDQIQTLNKLTGTAIRIDQELLIPAPDAPVPDPTLPAPAATTPALAAATVTHTVKPGESLDIIARYYGTSRNEIATTNHITDPRKLQVGQKLTITSARKNLGAAAPSTTPAPAAAATTTTVAMTTTTTQQPAQTLVTPTLIPADTSPISPVMPVLDSPITPAPVNDTPLDAPPVVTPQDPASPIGIPQQ